MLIDKDINKDNIHVHLNSQVTTHYEIEDFRDPKNIDLYLQELIFDLVERKENESMIESLMEEFNEI
ncbi:MAG: hypothetical protein E7E21_05020 [Peptostreptococcaceae bacterium]|nr:hypothetical protein [Peptostreptococcaceae bacterium]